MLNLFKDKLSVRRILQVISDISKYDLDFEIIRSEVTITWYKETLIFDNVKIVKEGHKGDMTFDAKNVIIEIYIFDNEKELLVFKSKEFEVFRGDEVKLLRVDGSRALDDEVIKWLHQGPWCNFIESKIQELEKQIDKIKHKKKQELNEQAIEQHKQNNKTINHFNKIFSKKF